MAKSSMCEKGDLIDLEKTLFDRVLDGNVDEVQRLLGEQDVRVDCLDKDGMTPLQQAAYKGNGELAKLLLTHGADVNSNYHDHGYTTLMFAALSGNTDVTRIVLEAGADIDRENSVGRTAAQMAGFVGQHQCVTMINNFFRREDLDYYTEPRGLEKEPKLAPELAPAVHTYILIINLNPVNLSLHLQKNTSLLDNSYHVAKVLDLLCEKMMKQKHTNEVMAIKFHYLASLVRHCQQSRLDRGDNLQFWIKSMLRGRESDGFPESQEKFLRSILKDFPYVESQMLQQMVRSLAPVKIGDHPNALSVLNSSINGQRFAADENTVCNTCGEIKGTKKCSACKMVSYCGPPCQKLHWFVHKKMCNILAVMYKAQEEERLKMEEEKRKLEEQEALEKKMKEAEISDEKLSETEGQGDTDVNVPDVDEKIKTNKVNVISGDNKADVSSVPPS